MNLDNIRIGKNSRKFVLILFIGFSIVVMAWMIAFGRYQYLLLLLSVWVILFLFFKQYEVFILLLLILNHEVFFLFPQMELIAGRQYFQDFLYGIILITGVWYFFRKRDENEISFNKYVIAFLFIIGIALVYTLLHGQPLRYGLGAARYYFFILFYFVFMSRKINVERLFKLIIIAGVILFLLNNIQYIFFGKITIFHVTREGERAGVLRFLAGGYFSTFALLITFGEYLKRRKKIYLGVAVYIFAITTLQGQTRMVIFGLVVTIFIMMYLARFIDFAKLLLFGVPALVLVVWLLPVIQSSIIGKLFELTKYEYSGRTGNIGVRFDTYEYYLSEFVKSPLIGRGVWDDGFRENNPEDLKDKGIHLSDIGIMSVLFHFGMMGLLWLIFIFAKIYKNIFPGKDRLYDNVQYGLIGYFIYNIITMVTLNGITTRRCIIYLALVMAIVSQLKTSEPVLEEVA